jgi:hypothetical protein
MKPIHTSLLLCALLTGLTACRDDDFDAPNSGGGSTGEAGAACTFAATKQHIVTRAGDDVTTFKAGSDFRLFAAKRVQQTTTTQDDEGNTVTETKLSEQWYKGLYGVVGHSTADGSITYSPTVFYTSYLDELDFYAVAIDRDKAGYSIPVTFAAADAVNDVYPTLDWSLGDGLATSPAAPFQRLGDLMISNTVKAHTQNDGQVTLPFKHALTRFTFDCSKVDETQFIDDASGKSAWLTNVRLLGIGVEGTTDSARLDIGTGKWTYLGDDPYEMLCDNTTWKDDAEEKQGILLSTTSKQVPDTLLLFPNGEKLLTLRVTLYYPKMPQMNGVSFLKESEYVSFSGNDTEGYTVEIRTPLDLQHLTGDNTDTKSNAFSFEANYSYQFSIVAMRNDVSVLVIAPTVYDWIDETLVDDESLVLGQPVSFGGLMWMDRNIGASTYDAENDFYGAIGYYYQYGRNIPYIMDVAKLKHYIDDDDNKTLTTTGSKGFTVMLSTAESYPEASNQTSPYYAWYLHDGKKTTRLTEEVKETLAREQVECFYTYDHKGDTVLGCLIIAKDDTKPIRFVGDVLYKADNVTVDDELTHKYYRFSVNKTSGLREQWTYAQEEGRPYAGNYWDSQSNQPCPKGWRLPTHQDLYTFMPWGGMLVWSSTTTNGTVYTSDGKTAGGTHYWDYKKEYASNDKVQAATSFYDNYGATWTYDANDYKGGWYRKDEADADTGMEGWTQECRFGQRTDSEGRDYNVVYMLKYKGTEQAYRIRIISRYAKGYKDKSKTSKNKKYIIIERFSAQVGKTIDDYVQGGKDQTEWDNPIESIQYPCAGFIVTDATLDLRTFGMGAVLRTADSYDSGSTHSNWAHYMSTTNLSLAVPNNSRRSLGDQVRCCRDISVSD